ncbi:MAG TPA: alpha/beta hydrolase [Gemmatimonadales bacterium]|nr:alpha/beta hydrolase [Gemmatimonadales bacterium]
MESVDLGFVHRYVPATDPNSRLALLLLHGTGGNENDLLSLGSMLAPGAAQLSPRGKVLERGMPRFFRRIAEGVFDLDDLRLRTIELADFVRAARAHYGLDDRRLIAVGFSNGANIAASLLLLKPGVLDGAVLFRPMVPFEPSPPPNLAGARVLIAAGEHDPIAPPREAERLAALLRHAGADVQVHWSPAAHGLVEADVNAARAWLR